MDRTLRLALLCFTSLLLILGGCTALTDFGHFTGGGGSDANVFNAAGLPALTLGVGFENAHSPQECMSLERLAELADMAAAVVRAAGSAA